MVFCLPCFPNRIEHSGPGFKFWNCGGGGWKIRSWKLALVAYCLKLQYSTLKKKKKKVIWEAREIAQWFRCLARHSPTQTVFNPFLVPRWKDRCGYVPVIPMLGMGRQVTVWDSIVSNQPSLIKRAPGQWDTISKTTNQLITQHGLLASECAVCTHYPRVQRGKKKKQYIKTKSWMIQVSFSRQQF